MKNLYHLVGWISIAILFLATHQAAAQCNPPGAPYLQSSASSSSLTLNWTPIVGVSQYQIRYWETIAPGDKTVISDWVSAPFVLNGLKKNTTYTVQIRAICGGTTSAWGPSANFLTTKATETCGNPTGVAVVPGISKLTVSWTSGDSHTIRYRLGYTGDWIIPSGALAIQSSPYVITGLTPGTYQVEVKHNCSTASSNFFRVVKTVQDGCATPAVPTVLPDVISASVVLPVAAGVSGYNVAYRKGTVGPWEPVGFDIPPSLCYVSPPFQPATVYQVISQAICSVGTSDFSAPATFSTQASSSCLVNRDFGKDLSVETYNHINDNLNSPSPYTFGSMIGVNDGGLFFRSFQNETSNPITQLTTQYRNFHTIDEDFNASMIGYDQNIKPKNTIPEGTPHNTARNKGFYAHYRQANGFTNITAAIELLQYGPQTWKDKIYKESDWSASGAVGIRTAFENYTKQFIDDFAPANGGNNQMLVANFQVGNELWDYPVKLDYQNLLLGARSAFVSKYGPKSAGGWKMKLVLGAFQAFREETCLEVLRDTSNCGGGLERHDFIGNYLDLTDCDVLKDIDAIDCHPYSFITGTTNWTYPENPLSETRQIRNLAGWLEANSNGSTGVLSNTRLWSSEFGFDSNSQNGVGEKTQSAYLIRGFLMHSRFHFEKVFFYNAFDHNRLLDGYYKGLFNSTGFWRLGTAPGINAWPSPLPAYGATAKPAWFGMLDFKGRFGDYVFNKALVEDTTAYVYLISKPDGTDPYLVFWSPNETNDVNINLDIPVNLNINWTNVLPQGYALATTDAQLFSENSSQGQTFTAATASACGTATLAYIRRNPAFLPLISCNNCPKMLSFKRVPHSNPSCNSAGDYYYEVKLNHVTANDEITISGLPTNGLNIALSGINDIAFDGTTYLSNLQFVSNSSLRWLVNVGNGMNQTLKLYYCWASTYPSPVNASTATSSCSGIVMRCVESSSESGPGNGDRSDIANTGIGNEFHFTVQPNPGTDHFTLTYFGEQATQANLRIIAATGQLMSTYHAAILNHQEQWKIDVSDLPPGVYFLCLQSNQEVKYQVWEKS